MIVFVLAMFMTIMDATIVNVVLLTLAHEFHVSSTSGPTTSTGRRWRPAINGLLDLLRRDAKYAHCLAARSRGETVLTCCLSVAAKVKARPVRTWCGGVTTRDGHRAGDLPAGLHGVGDQLQHRSWWAR